MLRTRILIFGALAFTGPGTLNAAADIKPTGVEQLKPGSNAIWIPDVPSRVTTQSAVPLKVENVRLEAAPPIEGVPSTVLKFGLLNVSPTELTDLLLEISVMEKPEENHGLSTGRMRVRPFRIRGNVVLKSGYAVEYELLLRALSSDCDCVASVEVLSVRSLPDSGP